jgi:hypothetical protein
MDKNSLFNQVDGRIFLSFSKEVKKRRKKHGAQKIVEVKDIISFFFVSIVGLAFMYK